MMSVLPNTLSLSRFFLAFLLFSDLTYIRLLAILLAGLTDFLDGYLARKLKCISTFGRVADPLGDKFFILIGLYVFLREGNLTYSQALLMLSRDVAVVAFGLFLVAVGKFKEYPIRAIICGKITTTLQLIVFVAITLGIQMPFPIFLIFGLLGILSFYELYVSISSNLSIKPPNS